MYEDEVCVCVCVICTVCTLWTPRQKSLGNATDNIMFTFVLSLLEAKTQDDWKKREWGVWGGDFRKCNKK